jgi:hypothetical protein
LDNTVVLDFLWLYLPNSHDASTVLLTSAKQLVCDWILVHHDHIGKQDGEGLVPY